MVNDQPDGMTTQPSTGQAIQAWLARHCLPIQHETPGSGSNDLAALKEILRDVRVVGLGESTHGTREFFRFKHRLVEFLVTEMGFTVFTIESSSAAGSAINEYILHGIGDLAEVLSNQGYVGWDTEEFTDLLRWMRTYNQTRPDEKKVLFYGLDVWRNDLGRAAVLDYLGRVAPGRMADAILLFDAFGQEDRKTYVELDADTQKKMVQIYPRLQALIDDFNANRDQFISRSSTAEFLQTLHAMEVMKQWLVGFAPELRPGTPENFNQRSRHMGENLLYLIEQGSPETKYIYWAANFHVSFAEPGSEDFRAGYRLREKFGPQYYSLGLHFNHGSLQARTLTPEGLPGPLTQVLIPPAPECSFPWHLSRTKLDRLFINLREPVNDPFVKEWLCMTHSVPWSGWITNPEDKHTEEINMVENFDGLVFFDQTSAVHPTAKALKHCELHGGGYF